MTCLRRTAFPCKDYENISLISAKLFCIQLSNTFFCLFVYMFSVILSKWIAIFFRSFTVKAFIHFCCLGQLFPQIFLLPCSLLSASLWDSSYMYFGVLHGVPPVSEALLIAFYSSSFLSFGLVVSTDLSSSSLILCQLQSAIEPF